MQYEGEMMVSSLGKIHEGEEPVKEVGVEAAMNKSKQNAMRY